MTAPGLARLAAAHGVATSYVDWAGEPTGVSDDAVIAALAALGIDAATPAQVQAALDDLERAPWRRLLPPSLVRRLGEPATVLLHASGPVELRLELEDGSDAPVSLGPVSEQRGGVQRRSVTLPSLPLGWHRLQATGIDAQGSRRTAECVVLVAPRRVPGPTGRVWGWMVQLYSLRSQSSWGMGDYADLATIVAAVGADGAGVVLLNPLHAESPVVPVNPSPYSPSSRRFRSVLGLHVEDVPEYRDAPADIRQAVQALRPPAEPDRIPRDPVWEAKLAAIELLWPLHRGSALADWRTEQGPALEQFATFCALAEVHGLPWQQWPEPLRRPDTDAVVAAAAELADRVAFFCWLQLLVDEQLAGLGAELSIGLIHDLAVGVDAGGADAWALQDALALTTTVGAPPDSFNQQGQDWGLPPWRPDRLAELGYRPLRDVVRSVVRHAGGLRIDHVMGLFRLWWVPSGAGAAEGTYVSYDADAMLAVLALEAHRAGAIVVGEDLGTVEDRVRVALAETGILGSAVLWFEQDDDAPLPPGRWRRDVLATVTTHDLPTAAGFLADEHVRVRAELDQLGVPREQEQVRVAAERAALVAMLEREGLVQACDGNVALAMHAALVASPARLVLAAFGDAVGDLRQPNLPGTVDQYPNWRLPVADGAGRPMTLEQVLAHPGVRRLTRLLQEGVAASGEGVR